MMYPNDHSEYFASGKAKFASGDYQGSINDFNKALEINPTDPEIIWKRGIALGRLWNHKAAQEDYMQASELKKNINRVSIKIAKEEEANARKDSHESKERYKAREAKKYVKKATDIWESNPEKGIELCTKAIALDSQNKEAYYLKGCIRDLEL